MNKQELLQRYLNNECSTEEMRLLFKYLQKGDVEEVRRAIQRPTPGKIRRSCHDGGDQPHSISVEELFISKAVVATLLALFSHRMKCIKTDTHCIDSEHANDEHGDEI